ncbi:AraC family transcriptional regulator [Paenibacillus tepidiphilus]|uniref:AraC family transcriptional regulator n=1 Tax=Paenibacillus tepidiphilus TaxID=2608683 RepID=UPI0012394DB7|nr:helix-turn-helix domain-containing protein [Paenibacillus tepidiphilus]
MSTIENTRPDAGPALAYIGRAGGKPDWRFPAHQHEDVSEIVFIAHGEGVIKINGQPFAVQAGDMLIYNQGIIHEECASPICPLDMYYCGLVHAGKPGGEPELLIPADASPYIRTREKADHIRYLFDMLYAESGEQAEGYEAVCSGLLTALITLIRRMTDTQVKPCKKDPDALAVSLKEYLDEHYLCHLSLNDIAGFFHMNAYYLAHVFKKKYNDSPINYMLRRRMGEAKRLLVNTDMKIREIADFLGYENANYFSILFTKTMGESPTQFKRSERKERIDLLQR